MEREAQEEKEAGAWRTTRTHDPRQLVEQERIVHDMTHFTCRSWCRHCVRGRGKGKKRRISGLLFSRLEVGHDGETAYERLKGKAEEVEGMRFAEGIQWKRRRAEGPLGQLTSLWEDGVCLGIKATT